MFKVIQDTIGKRKIDKKEKFAIIIHATRGDRGLIILIAG